MLLSFVSIVLIFGIITTFAASLDSERELKNINTLYEERGISIAKTIDASITSDAQIHNDSQTVVDRLMASDLGVSLINIHGKAPDGIKMPGYWRGYWILASSIKSNVHKSSNAVDLVAMDTNKYILASYTENGKPIIHITYPLHDPNGKAIATAEIEFDMSAIQSQMIMTKTNKMQIALVITLLAIIATIVLANSITKPILHLKSVADKVSMGDLQQEVTINSKDEIGELGRSFQRMINAFKISQAMNEELSGEDSDVTT